MAAHQAGTGDSMTDKEKPRTEDVAQEILCRSQSFYMDSQQQREEGDAVIKGNPEKKWKSYLIKEINNIRLAAAFDALERVEKKIAEVATKGGNHNAFFTHSHPEIKWMFGCVACIKEQALAQAKKEIEKEYGGS